MKRNLLFYRSFHNKLYKFQIWTISTTIHHHHHHHFVFRLLLIIVHTKARVRRYQQLNPSNMSYLVHLPSLVRAFSCHPSHTSSMSSYSPPSLHHLPPLNVCT